MIDFSCGDKAELGEALQTLAYRVLKMQRPYAYDIPEEDIAAEINDAAGYTVCQYYPDRHE